MQFQICSVGVYHRSLARKIETTLSLSNRGHLIEKNLSIMMEELRRQLGDGEAMAEPALKGQKEEVC